jgi:hypothetical protein
MRIGHRVARGNQRRSRSAGCPRGSGAAPRERLERAAPSDAAPASHDADERILDGIRAELLVA